MEITKSYLKHLTYQVTGAAIEVHKALGPGLLESIYHKCMVHELTLRKIAFKSEYRVPLEYKDLCLAADLRSDFFIENSLVVELKAVDQIHPIHEAQLLTYMKLLGAPKGILINFNVTNIYKEGQRSFVLDAYIALSD